MDSYTYQIPMI